MLSIGFCDQIGKVPHTALYSNLRMNYNHSVNKITETSNLFLPHRSCRRCHWSLRPFGFSRSKRHPRIDCLPAKKIESENWSETDLKIEQTSKIKILEKAKCKKSRKRTKYSALIYRSSLIPYFLIQS